MEPLTAWNVEADVWGGRLGDPASSPTQHWSSSQPTPADSMPNSQSTFDSKVREWTSAEPFIAQAQEQLVENLRAALDSANQEYSQSCGGVLPGLADALPEAHSPLSAPTNSSSAVSNTGWTILPPSPWFKRPLGLQEQVGTDLLDQAMSKLLKSDGSDEVTMSISTQDQGPPKPLG